MAVARIGLVTVSDRASSGTYEDRGGPALRDYLSDRITSPHEFIVRLVPDEIDRIASAITDLADDERCCMVLTTGGTGPSPRDVTPEATESVCDRLLPGFGEAMRAVSRITVPTAILSRQVAGTRGTCLVINLPGKPTAIAECLDAVIAAIPDCIDLLGGPDITLKPDIVAPRPHRS